MIKLSIAIPLYNGAEFITDTIESIINQENFEDVELVFCDDISTDDSCRIVEKYSSLYINIKLFKNEINLGMDKNFEKVVSHCSGEFFWFSGQDDIFLPGAIAKVFESLQHNAVDFIFMNFSQNSHNLRQVITPKFIPIENDTLCENPQDFFQSTKMTIPSFLPAYVMRKALWDKSDKSFFYGTQYIQLGVLLDILPNIKTYVVAKPYIKGRIPDTGWQQIEERRLDIFSGYLEVFYHHKIHTPEVVSKKVFSLVKKRVWPLIVRRIILQRSNNQNPDKKITIRLRKILSPKEFLFIQLVIKMPYWLVKTAKNCYFFFKNGNTSNSN